MSWEASFHLGGMAVADRRVFTVTNCRVCGRHLSERNMVLNLGAQWVVDFVDDETRAGRRPLCPLELVHCSFCDLVQLRHTVNPDCLFREFWYRSGVNEQMQVALKDIVDGFLKRIELRSKDVVGDIGANDGTMLTMFPSDTYRVGFEPAQNFSKPPEACAWVKDYFSEQAALWGSQGRSYKALAAIAMFYDLDRPIDFLRDVKRVLAPDGLFVIQMNYLYAMLQQTAFDNIGHEHLCYYGLRSLELALAQVGLEVEDVEENQVNGGSFRVWIRHHGYSEPTRRVAEFREREADLPLSQLLGDFSYRVVCYSYRLMQFLQELRNKGKTVMVYGASTRGSTLLQTVLTHRPLGTEIGEYLVGAAERDPNKYGKKTVGTWLPIIPEEGARKVADYFLVLPAP